MGYQHSFLVDVRRIMHLFVFETTAILSFKICNSLNCFTCYVSERSKIVEVDCFFFRELEDSVVEASW